MGWNNITPAWMLNSKFEEATKKFQNDKITKQEAYERIKNIKEVPDRIKENWEPDKDEN